MTKASLPLCLSNDWICHFALSSNSRKGYSCIELNKSTFTDFAHCSPSLPPLMGTGNLCKCRSEHQYFMEVNVEKLLLKLKHRCVIVTCCLVEWQPEIADGSYPHFSGDGVANWSVRVIQSVGMVLSQKPNNNPTCESSMVLGGEVSHVEYHSTSNDTNSLPFHVISVYLSWNSFLSVIGSSTIWTYANYQSLLQTDFCEIPVTTSALSYKLPNFYM